MDHISLIGEKRARRLDAIGATNVAITIDVLLCHTQRRLYLCFERSIHLVLAT